MLEREPSLALEQRGYESMNNHLHISVEKDETPYQDLFERVPLGLYLTTPQDRSWTSTRPWLRCWVTRTGNPCWRSTRAMGILILRIAAGGRL